MKSIRNLICLSFLLLGGFNSLISAGLSFSEGEARAYQKEVAEYKDGILRTYLEGIFQKFVIDSGRIDTLVAAWKRSQSDGKKAFSNILFDLIKTYTGKWYVVSRFKKIPLRSLLTDREFVALSFLCTQELSNRLGDTDERAILARFASLKRLITITLNVDEDAFSPPSYA